MKTPRQIHDCLEPHAWNKFQQAQDNLMRFILPGCRRRKRFRRARKWAKEMARWMDGIYKDDDLP